MSDLHVLLIGIDAYLPNRLPDGGYYPQLGGCVQDVSRVEDFLRTRLGVPAERIQKLTASLPEDPGPPPAVTRGGSPPLWPSPVEPSHRWPTYANMVAAFKEITARANPGDEVHVHYSGHGGRAVTHYPEVKGEGGWDETLVPLDIGDASARYVRDIELSLLVKEMVEKKLRVTLVFDSCHSGGAMRTDAFARGAHKLGGKAADDTTERPKDSLVASREDLLASWTGKPVVPDRRVAPGGVVMRDGGMAMRDGGGAMRTGMMVMRDALANDEWLPGVQGYVLLAACCDQESAYECAFDGQVGGALTHWFLDALQTRPTGWTYRNLYDRLVAKIHGAKLQQTPMLLGESDWGVFGSGSGAVDRGSAVDVLDVVTVDPAGRRLLLNTGQSQGIDEGARFEIYPLDVVAAATAVPTAVVEVRTVGATESWAEIVEGAGESIAQGDQAFLLDFGADAPKSAVRLLRQGSAAEEELANRIVAAGGFLRQVAEGDPSGPEELRVAINGNGEIEIQDAAGQPVPHLGPALRAESPTAAGETVARLVHLARYRFVQQIENCDPLSLLAGKLSAEFLGVQKGYKRGQRPAPRPGTAATDSIELQAGEWTFLRIVNRSSRILNLVVLNLRTGWGITQIYPASHQGAFLPLDSQKELVLPIEGGLPAGLAEASDRIKVFATIGTLDYHWLELPSLRAPEPPAGGTTGGETPESTARSSMVPPAEPSVSRGLNPSEFPSEEWVTAEVTMRVRPSQPPERPVELTAGRSWHPSV